MHGIYLNVAEHIIQDQTNSTVEHVFGGIALADINILFYLFIFLSF